jgi:hypothetical protein
MRRHADARIVSAASHLAARLRARQDEIQHATLARVFSLSAANARPDPEYEDGLRRAVGAGVELSILVLEGKSEACRHIEVTLLNQARMAARSGVGLDVLVRRYVATHGLVVDFAIQEAGLGLSLEDLKRSLRGLALTVDPLLTAATAAYGDELQSLARRHGGRLGAVERLLRGELIGEEELGYDLDACHIAVVADGASAMTTLRMASRTLGAAMLAASPSDSLVWGWLGRRKGYEPSEIDEFLKPTDLSRVVVAIGIPGNGVSGWRNSHRQARAAMEVARRTARRFVRYSEVALLSACVENDLLEASLRRLYLDPLDDLGDRGHTLEGTLRCYLNLDCNASSAAASLGVSRNTVTARIQECEGQFRRSLTKCRAEVDLALQLRAIS